VTSSRLVLFLKTHNIIILFRKPYDVL